MLGTADRELSRFCPETSTYLQFWEAQAHQEVGSPVGETRDSYGGRSGPLGEEFCNNEPRNGTWTHLKTGHKAEHRDNGQVAQRLVALLLKRKKENEDVRKRKRTLTEISEHTRPSLTTYKREMVIMSAQTAIPARPIRCSVLRPARSTKKS